MENRLVVAVEYDGDIYHIQRGQEWESLCGKLVSPIGTAFMGKLCARCEEGFMKRKGENGKTWTHMAI